MKKPIFSFTVAVLAISLFKIVTLTASAQGTVFTYQGKLDSNGAPYTGTAEFQPTLWSAASGGSQIAPNNPASVVVSVTNGLFVLPLDFGANFSGGDRWLQLEVRTTLGPFTPISPRQQFTPTPYAMYSANAASAATAATAGSVNAANITGTLLLTQLPGTVVTNSQTGVNLTGSFTGNGSTLSNLNPTSLVLISTNISITSWGWNQYGQRSIPTNAQHIIAMSAGNAHSLALRNDGTVVAWGAGDSTNSGNSVDFGQSIVPSDLNNVVAISAGGFHNLALRANGSIVAWGHNVYGQTNIPPGLTSAVAISAGVFHNLALKPDGTVVAWGAGTTNDPNDGIDFGQSIVPPGLNNVMQVAAGYISSTVLKSNGTVVAWGDNRFNETNVPPGLSNIVTLAAGGVHTLALKNDGTVIAWGAGTTNDPDNGIDFGQSIVPPGLSNVVAIAAGLFNSIALKADGTVVAWGANMFGQSSVPTGLNNVLAIASGPTAYHVLALRKQSDAPVAWLNSDNTFNGNITVNGDTSVSGELHASDLRLNDGNLWLRDGHDQNSGLGWYSAGTKNFTGSFYDNGPNGPVLFGEGGGALGTSGTNGQQVALVWNALGRVGIGTTFPNAPLDFGAYSASTKMLFPGGYGIGSTNSQFRFHLGGSGGSFAFLNAPNGNQMATMTPGFGSGGARLNVYGQVQVGNNAQYTAAGASETLRIVRGSVDYLGGILKGSGFSVSHTGTGAYTITFSTAFDDTPTVVVTVQHGIAQSATVSSPNASTVYVRTWEANGAASDQYFHFIAVGPQ